MAKSASRKTQYHTTLSRRDFMKMMGLGVAGAGALSLGVPMLEPFKDLDEMMANPAAKRSLPSWVKEVDKPTVEIDWDNLEPFQISNTLFNPESWPSVDEYMATMKAQVDFVTKSVRENKYNHSLRDYALVNAAQAGAFVPDWTPSWEGPDLKSMQNLIPQHPCFNWTHAEFGVPKWTGTPEEASHMIRVFGRLYGAADLGFLHLDDKIKKVLFSNIKFEDVEEGYDTSPQGNMAEGLMRSTPKILPNKDLWIICALMPQSIFQGRASEGGEWGGSNFHAYTRVSVFAYKLKVFLKTLGYQAYGGHSAIVGSATAFGVMSGLVEYARTTQMISPIFGNTFRTVLPIVTDLPLAPTKPIDAGILEFCRSCKKCARECPAKALSMADEPVWGGDKVYQRKGIKGYYMDNLSCIKWQFSHSPDCGVCQSVCPFSKFNEASVHQVIRATIGTTPALNQIIAKMDDVFGYGMKDEPDYSIWDKDQWDIPLYGLDRSRS